jgi:hypothetical protein
MSGGWAAQISLGNKLTTMNRYLLRGLSVVLLLVAPVYAQTKPEISVSPGRVKSGNPVLLTGTGFTPNRTVMSHLRRPDGSEYNPLRLRTDERGEFNHQIDTVLLDIGTFELWVEDEASEVVSTRARFSVE